MQSARFHLTQVQEQCGEQLVGAAHELSRIGEQVAVGKTGDFAEVVTSGGRLQSVRREVRAGIGHHAPHTTP
jgi:hypothetical protein